MEKLVKILMVEDNASDAELIQRALKKTNNNYQFMVTDNRSDYVNGLISYDPDLIISDHTLPGFDSGEVIKIAKEIYSDIPCVLLTGSIPEESAYETMKAGFDDYILKDSLVRLPIIIERIVKNKEAKNESERIEILQTETVKAFREIEEANNNMKASICYAKRIQEAMLPEKALLDAFFTESFVLYEPKDILSGDFYWYTAVGDKFIIISADCTGHGVPGSLMSMIGYTVLNHIVKLKGVISPALILKKLDKAVKKILKQGKESCGPNDGMDLSVCTIDTKDKVITFSGANRPLLHISNGNTNILAGDKTGIGGITSTVGSDFSETAIPYEKGDKIYMFSDGYSDQFGGPLNKKLMKKNFIKLIQSFGDLSFPEQGSALLQRHKEWMGVNEQTDDILVMGIKL